MQIGELIADKDQVMTNLELTEIAQAMFCGKHVGKMLRAYRTTGLAIEVDEVNLEQSEAILHIEFKNMCIKKYLVAQPLHGNEPDPAKAFKACLEADALDAFIASDVALSPLDNMTLPVHEPDLSTGRHRPFGWLYHLADDGTLRVYEYAESASKLTEIRRGHFN